MSTQDRKQREAKTIKEKKRQRYAVKRRMRQKKLYQRKVKYDKSCPRRLSCNATTINRDRNAAWNITLIGFSTLVGQDNLSLPVFQQIRTNK